jgi:HSP20 family molecular chaperone IbpA
MGNPSIDSDNFGRRFNMIMLARRGNGLGSLLVRDPFSSPRDEMSELRSQLFGQGGDWFGGALVPSINMSETDNALEVKMDLPGISPKDVDIQSLATSSRSVASGEKRRKRKAKRSIARNADTAVIPARLRCLATPNLLRQFHIGNAANLRFLEQLVRRSALRLA